LDLHKKRKKALRPEEKFAPVYPADQFNWHPINKQFFDKTGQRIVFVKAFSHGFNMIPKVMSCIATGLKRVLTKGMVIRAEVLV